MVRTSKQEKVQLNYN